MAHRAAGWALVGLLLAGFARAADEKRTYTIEIVADCPAPKELAAPIRKLLGPRCVRLCDAEGNALLEVWFRKEVPVKATETQMKNGLTYSEVPASTVLGVVRVLSDITDYRKQNVAAGVYTLRLGTQPVSDDHVGTARYRDFGLLCPAEHDKKPALLEPKALYKLSGRTTGKHPSVLMLFPGKGAGARAKLVAKPGGHRVLLVRLPARGEECKGTLLLGLTLIGTSPRAPE